MSNNISIDLHDQPSNQLTKHPPKKLP